MFYTNVEYEKIMDIIKELIKKTWFAFSVSMYDDLVYPNKNLSLCSKSMNYSESVSFHSCFEKLHYIHLWVLYDAILVRIYYTKNPTSIDNHYVS